ncbi:site-2 protease family protein [Ekhidna sp. MALMAid0563]|uniref:site-2 protease family protein n=1 Tax=Ekhidna sp. MALMAid0563 TaxID=3143937 RepID=UPI0032DF20F1
MNKQQKTLLIQLGLFIVTLITTTFAGAEWTLGKYVIFGMTWDDFLFGFNFSIPFLLILTVHEFGHYFTARYHKINVTLPYYIPMWFGFAGLASLGTMGAFIRIKENILSRTKYFDVGVSGPIAGFVVAIFLLVYGFKTLPETEYIYEIHPEYEVFGENFEERMEGLDTLILKNDLNPDRLAFETLQDTIDTGREGSVYFGDNILMNLGRQYLAPDDRYVPSSKELMHYPVLLAAYLAFFFTALNLLPIGQLDGGHVLFGLFGAKNHAIISRVLFTAFLFYAGLGWVTTADLPNNSIEAMSNFVISIALYLFVVYWSAFSVFKQKRDRLLFATVLFTVQFFMASIFKVEGYTGWLLFSILIGRFIGVDHPPVVDNSELSIGRRILGWVALIIFVLSFSPQPLVIEGL